ncbi:MAG: hypothetical protein MUE46_11520 [Xanthomonadales bacterium]|nr:hypothetical protein [Xanthomonadales bacterium]
MGLFDFLRKPKWQHKDAAVRAAVVAEDRSPELLAQLQSFALKDPDVAVRRAAFRRLEDLELKAGRAESDPDATLRAELRQEVLHKLIGGASLPATRREALFAQLESGQLEALAVQATDSAMRRAALERIQRAGFLGDRAIAESDPAIRLWLVERIDAPATLERIEDAARKKDKRLYKRIREKLDAIANAVETPERIEARGMALCAALEQVLKTVPTDAAAQLAGVQAGWAELAAKASPALITRYQGLVDAVQRMIEGVARGPAPKEAPAPVNEAEVAPAPVVAAPAPAEPDAALAAAMARIDALADADGAEAWEAAATSLTEAWKALVAPIEADRAAKSRAEARVLAWRAARRAEVEAREAALQTVVSALKAELAELADAIEAGDIKSARVRLKALEAREQPARGDWPPAERRRLDGLKTRVEKLVAWERWSNNQVRAELCAEVETLPAAGLHPDAVASKVRELSDKLKALDALEGLSEEEAKQHGLNRRFRALCHAVLKPAQGYFEKRRELKGEQARATMDWLAQAEAALAAADTPIKALFELKREAGERLRALDGVEAAQRGEASRRLKALSAGVSTRVDSRFAEAEQAKRRLLSRLKRELEGRSLPEALDLAKAAQRDWKALGAASRKVEDTLWAELRALVDPHFERARMESEAATAEARAKGDAVRTQLSAAEQRLADAATQAPAALREQIAALEADWRALGDVDPRDERRHDTLLQSLGKALAAAERRAATAAQASALDLADALAAAEADPASADRDALAAAIEQSGASAELKRIAHARLAALGQGIEVDRSDAARDLAIAFEHLAAIDSPAEDQRRRLDYQVKLLAQKHQQGRGVELAQLLGEWLACGPLPAEVRGELQPRIARAMAVLAG